MAADRNNVSRLGGQYMVQDRDHMSETTAAPGQATRGNVRQSEQSRTESRQQVGGDHGASRQQGKAQRQAH